MLINEANSLQIQTAHLREEVNELRIYTRNRFEYVQAEEINEIREMIIEINKNKTE
jgi:hypothetical protein